MFRGKGFRAVTELQSKTTKPHLKTKSLLRRILKRIWHDVYLVISFTLLRPLATTCRQTTDFRNTGNSKVSRFTRTKYNLHLSICDACSRYLQITEYFEKNMSNYEKIKMSDAEVQDFNKRLIKNLKQN
jgi:hypothetical protein